MELFTREGRKFYFFLAKTAGYWPHSVKTFRTAFIHKSAGKKKQGGDQPDNNERLEYLGDAVIETVVSDILYHKYPDADEGFLSHIRSNMVCRARLNAVSFALGLDKYVVIASRKDMENSHISGDILEAFVAAIYLDGGMRRAFKFVERAIANPDRIDEALHDSTQTNYKSMLVNLGEQNAVEILFETRRTDTARRIDDEALNFTCEIKIADTTVAHGQGRSKKMAEQRAAEIVCNGIETGEIDLQQLKHKAPEEESAETGEEAAQTEIAARPQPSTPAADIDVQSVIEQSAEPANMATALAERAAHWGREIPADYPSRFKEYAEALEAEQAGD